MCSGPRSSPPCGASSSPARSAMSNAGAKSAVRAAALVVGEAEADHAAVDVLAGQPGQGAGVERVAGAVGRDDHRDAEAGALAGVADRVEHQVGERGDARRTGRRSRSGRPGSPATGRRRRRRPRRPRRTSRRTSSSVRSTDRATSYRRWNRNQPFSSAAVSCGGHSDTSASGRWMPSRSASSSRVPCRIDPVKWRCRWAFGREWRSRTLVIVGRLTAFGPLGRGCVDSILGGFPPW